MTVTNETSSVTHLGNGATTVWPYSFIILKASDAEVRLYDLLTDISTIVPSGEYTISGIGNPNGGDVTYAPGGIPLPATKRITISRLVAFTQETDLTNQTPYYPEVLEEQLDYMVMQTQQLKADLARAVLVQPGSPIDPNELLNEVKQDAAAAAGSANAAASSAGTAANSAIAADTAGAVQAGYAAQWAIRPHNDPIPVEAGGDGATTFSALHHSTNAEGFAGAAEDSAVLADKWANWPHNVEVLPGKFSAIHWKEEARLIADGLNLPTIAPGDAGKALLVNPGETGFLLSDIKPSIVRVSRTGNTILTAANVGQMIDVTNNTFTQTITAAATLGNGWFCYYRNSGTGTVTLDPNSTETIDGLTTLAVYPRQTYLIVCTGLAFTAVLISGRRVFIANETQATASGGGTGVATTWTKRVLNTIVLNTISGASLALNEITLPAGNYQVSAAAPHAPGARLRVNGAGISAPVYGALYTQPGAATLIGSFSLASAGAVALEYYIVQSFGNATDLGGAGGTAPYVFAQIQIEKVA